METHIRAIVAAGAAWLLVLWSAVPVHAACPVSDLPTPAPRDPVVRVLSQQSVCPMSGTDFRNAIKQSGGRLESTIVDFVGFHSPNAVALFIFEIASVRVASCS